MRAEGGYPLADSWQLALIKRSVQEWNAWRKARRRVVKVDLNGVDLHRTNLSGADLSKANLTWARLLRADLTDANLSRANLGGAILEKACLSGAQLFSPDLMGANLNGADLSGVKWVDPYSEDITREPPQVLPSEDIT